MSVGCGGMAGLCCRDLLGVPLMSVYSSLTHALAEALVDVLWFIEGSEDDQMDPDDSVKVLEGVAHLVSKLSSDQRSELIDLLGAMAEAESDPALVDDAV